MTDDGDLLVDGGVLSNLPVAAMLSMGEGPVIAVDVLPGVDLTVDGRYSSTPGPARALFDRFASFGERRPFPTIFSILYRTALISNLRSLEETRSSIDLYLDPPVESFDIFEMQAIDRIVDVGYRFAKSRVPSSAVGLRRERRTSDAVRRSARAAVTNGAGECSQVER
jgi:NTE family protein